MEFIIQHIYSSLSGAAIGQPLIAIEGMKINNGANNRETREQSRRRRKTVK
jgi:hypothetical protein